MAVFVSRNESSDRLLAIAEERMSEVVERDRPAATHGGGESVETRSELGIPRSAQGAGTDAASSDAFL